MIGLLSTFRWLFNKVTDETISWYDSILFVLLPSIVRRITNWAINQLGSESFWASSSVGFATYVLMFYIFLRMWHDVRPKQAWIIIACWVPVSTASIILFLFSNNLLPS